MKKIFLLLVMAFAGNMLVAQNIQLNIKGLVNAKKSTPVVVTSANLETVTIQNHRGQSFDAQVYVVTRNQDNLTAALVNAANKGIIFPQIFIHIPLANGTKITHRLTNTFLSNYSSQNNSGQDPTEAFYIRFQTDDIVTNK